MYHTLYQIITNSGDGTNYLYYTTDPIVVKHWEKLANEGNEYYASGEGLQLRDLRFKTQQALDEFVLLNVYELTTQENWEEE